MRTPWVSDIAGQSSGGQQEEPLPAEWRKTRRSGATIGEIPANFCSIYTVLEASCFPTIQQASLFSSSLFTAIEASNLTLPAVGRSPPPSPRAYIRLIGHLTMALARLRDHEYRGAYCEMYRLLDYSYTVYTVLNLISFCFYAFCPSYSGNGQK